MIKILLIWIKWEDNPNSNDSNVYLDARSSTIKTQLTVSNTYINIVSNSGENTLMTTANWKTLFVSENVYVPRWTYSTGLEKTARPFLFHFIGQVMGAITVLGYYPYIILTRRFLRFVWTFKIIKNVECQVQLKRIFKFWSTLLGRQVRHKIRLDLPIVKTKTGQLMFKFAGGEGLEFSTKQY